MRAGQALWALGEEVLAAVALARVVVFHGSSPLAAAPVRFRSGSALAGMVAQPSTFGIHLVVRYGFFTRFVACLHRELHDRLRASVCITDGRDPPSLRRRSSTPGRWRLPRTSDATTAASTAAIIRGWMLCRAGRIGPGR